MACVAGPLHRLIDPASEDVQSAIPVGLERIQGRLCGIQVLLGPFAPALAPEEIAARLGPQDAPPDGFEGRFRAFTAGLGEARKPLGDRPHACQSVPLARRTGPL